MAERGHRRFLGLILRFRWWILSVATLLAFVSGVRTLLTYAAIRSDMEELLPESAPSVAALEELRRRLPGLRHLGIVIDTGGPENLPAAQRFVDALAERIEGYPREVVGQVLKGSRLEREFAETFALQLTEPAQVRRLREALERRAEAPGDQEAVRQILSELREEQAAGAQRHAGSDYFVSRDGRTLVLLVQAASHATAFETDLELIERVRADVKALGFPAAFAPGLRLGYAGDVAIRVEETQGLEADLLVSGLVVFVLGCCSILIFYRSGWALFLLGLPLTYGALYSFALVALPPLGIRSLNSNTAFLGSIVVGNGINGGIMLLARYFEARREGSVSREALHTAVATTWRPTLAAALAAALAYAALIFTDARGFNQFGWIGGLGLVLCWACNFVLMPALLGVVGDRIRVRPRAAAGARPAWQRFVVARPGLVLASFGALGVLSVLGLAVRWGDFIEYDFSQLRRRDSEQQGERYWGKRMDEALGRYLTPTVVMTRSAEEAQAVRARLSALVAAGQAGGLIGSIRSAEDVLPPFREESRREARAVAATLTPRVLEGLPGPERAFLERALSERALAPLGPGDVPASLMMGLREEGGRIDRNVLVFPQLGGATWQGPRLFDFAHDVRRAATFGGEPRPVAGALLLAADISRTMLSDGPRVTAIALSSTLLVCWFAFRSAGRRALESAGRLARSPILLSAATVLSVLAGILLMLGLVAWLGEKLNFANFVALTITFGIAADYSINVLERYRHEQRLDLASALSATGGAVALCSATTIIGFGSLVMAENRALFSFGVLAIVGEFTCLAVAVLGLPAVLALRRGRKPGAKLHAPRPGNQPIRVGY